MGHGSIPSQRERTLPVLHLYCYMRLAVWVVRPLTLSDSLLRVYIFHVTHTFVVAIVMTPPTFYSHEMEGGEGRANER